MPVYTPENPYAPKRALYGQNDYIDILGENPDALKPHEVNYHVPKWLRGTSNAHHNDYQQALNTKAYFEKTAYPQVKPKMWDRLTNRISRRYGEMRTHLDQEKWTNYKGVRTGAARDPFKSPV